MQAQHAVLLSSEITQLQGEEGQCPFRGLPGEQSSAHCSGVTGAFCLFSDTFSATPQRPAKRCLLRARH